MLLPVAVGPHSLSDESSAYTMVEQSQAHGASSGKDAVSHQKLITCPAHRVGRARQREPPLRGGWTPNPEGDRFGVDNFDKTQVLKRQPTKNQPTGPNPPPPSQTAHPPTQSMWWVAPLAASNILTSPVAQLGCCW